jgi:hypothetical protein
VESEDAMTRADAKEAVLVAAELWWDSKRPIDYGPWDHERNPSVNCSTLEETRLACELVQYFRVRRDKR